MSVVFSRMSASSPGVLLPVHFKHGETGHGLIAITEPALTREGKGFPFGTRSVQRSAKALRECLRVTGVIGVRDNDKRRAAQRFEVRKIMFTHRQRVDEDITAGSYPRHAAKVEIAAFVEARPAEEIRAVQEFHDSSGAQNGPLTCYAIWPYLKALLAARGNSALTGCSFGVRNVGAFSAASSIT